MFVGEFARVGSSVEEIDTPALLIDLDVLEKNIKTMGEYYRSKRDAILLPHQKGHRLPIIARKQIEAGAKGVSMTSLGLAEYYVVCGIRDIFITNEICGDNKIRRLCSLSKQANIVVSVDSMENAKHLSETALENGVKLNVCVELRTSEIGAGVEFSEAKSLVKELTKLQGLNFVGLWEHQGELGGIKSWSRRREEHFKTLDKIVELKSEIEDLGIDVQTVSSGYTCTWNITPEYPNLRNVQVQAGSYVFSDWCSHELEGLEVFDYALTVLTRCISRPTPYKAIFDFGMNSCSDESTHDYHAIVGPKFKNLEGVKEVYEREEISVVKFEKPNTSVKVGEVYEIIPPHSDTTAKLYDKYYCIRKGKVEAIWPNIGRGLL
jgi:D-serine deaminase-like pyridoxal phosphate-dependent protein